MTTINTIEDLLQVLDEHPHWLEALRARLLTRELIELPEKFAAFVETTNQRFDKVEHRLGTLETDVKELKTDVKELKTDVKELKTDVKELKTDVKELKTDVTGLKTDVTGLKTDVTGLKTDVKELKTDVTGLKTDVKSLRDDMGILKGAHARNVAVEDATSIARGLGLRRTRTLSRDELWDLTETADTTDIPPNALRSFRQADLIMAATDQAGEPCYIAVEISFTANGRDTTRARRNAEFLTRFTGKPAYAVIAGLRQDNRTQPHIEAGEVCWHQLDPSDLEAD